AIHKKLGSIDDDSNIDLIEQMIKKCKGKCKALQNMARRKDRSEKFYTEFSELGTRLLELASLLGMLGITII
ncbi:MAG: hypothetical protein AAFY36_08645, partial [Bacteroidota bacterium]